MPLSKTILNLGQSQPYPLTKKVVVDAKPNSNYGTNASSKYLWLSYKTKVFGFIVLGYNTTFILKAISSNYSIVVVWFCQT